MCEGGIGQKPLDLVPNPDRSQTDIIFKETIIMIKRTLYFGNPAYLRTENNQLIIELTSQVRQGHRELICTPIEDIAIIILDSPQITITQALISKLLGNNVALISCNQNHMPTGLLLNLDGNSLQTLKFRAQIESSLPLRKQLWQQTVKAKIRNQAALLQSEGGEVKTLHKFMREVKSGDNENHEAKAASYYWRHLFPAFLKFKRDRFGPPPNNLLNYGYAILRAIVARSLVGSGLLPTYGIFHKNQYNSYCLADDIMEPYRPFVDKIVCDIVRMNGNYLQMTPSMKKQILGLPVMDVSLSGTQSPLMKAVNTTTSSLSKCFEGKIRKLIFPSFKEAQSFITE